MNVILIGYRASGKTSVGRKLAAQLWKTYADVDAETRKRFNHQTIREIWEAHGEPAWREAEAATLCELLGRDDLVISLGGGTPLIPDARQAIAAAKDATRLYLRCSPEELHRRIRQDAASTDARPNLTALGGGAEEIAAVLAEREPVYRELADHEFDVTHTSVDETVRFLIQRFL